MMSTMYGSTRALPRITKLTRVLALAGVLGLAGCLGGGGGDDPVAGAPVGGAVVVAGGVGAVGAGGGAAKAAPVAEAQVVVTAYTPGGTEVARATVISNPTGGYQVTLEDPNGDLANGGYVIVNVNRDGFTAYSTRLDFSARPQTLQVPDAELTGVVTSVSDVGGAITARAVGGAFIMGIVRTRDGSRRALAGQRYLAAKAAGGEPDLEINIPAASLHGVSSIRAQLQTFDSSNPDHARRFPGSYTDRDGNPIVSLGFDFMNLTDNDTGRNIGAAARAARLARGARKAAIDWANPTVVTRWLPQGSVNNLLQDACDDPVKPDIPIADETSNCAALRNAPGGATLGNEAAEGFQVPIYTYDPNTGRWDLFGIGTLVRNYNGDASSMVTWEQVGDANGDGTVDAADFRHYAGQHQLYVRIYVTNENFQRQYWNLDYPLLFEQPVELCVQGRVTRSDTGAPLAGQYLSFYDNDDIQTFSNGFATTNANGEYRITVIRQDDATDRDSDREGQLHYYNPFEERRTSITAPLAVSSSGCARADIALTPVSRATVRGRVVNEQGAPMANQDVYGFGDNRRFWARTGSDGRFSADILRNNRYDVYVGSHNVPLGWFRADDSVNDSSLENQDSDSWVVLKDIELANRAPYAWGYVYAHSLRLRAGEATATTQLYLYGSDSDGDYPIQWQVLDGATCNPDGTFSGGMSTGLSGRFTGATMTAVTDTSSANVATPEISLTQGRHTLVLALTDSADKQGCAVLGTVSVSPPLANRAPNIYWLAGDQPRYRKGATMTLTGFAWDPDGDPLTATWTTTAGQLGDDCGGGMETEARCTITAPDADTPVTVTLKVSDGRLESERSVRIQVGTAPGNVDVIVR
jgi:hypothetical protein